MICRFQTEIEEIVVAAVGDVYTVYLKTLDHTSLDSLYLPHYRAVRGGIFGKGLYLHWGGGGGLKYLFIILFINFIYTILEIQNQLNL